MMGKPKQRPTAALLRRPDALWEKIDEALQGYDNPDFSAHPVL